MLNKQNSGGFPYSSGVLFSSMRDFGMPICRRTKLNGSTQIIEAGFSSSELERLIKEKKANLKTED